MRHAPRGRRGCPAAPVRAARSPSPRPRPFPVPARPLAALNFPRYKIVVQVVLGQNKHQGVKVASRCLWDTENDSFASATFTNETLWATVMVFGLYTE